MPKSQYPYTQSPSNQYILTRDGQELARGTEHEVWKYVHKNHSFSVERALLHEGFKIQPIEETVEFLDCVLPRLETIRLVTH